MRKLLNPEVDTYIIGGLGSDRACMGDVVTELSKELDNVYGLTYHEASKSGKELWEATDQKNLVVYSGSGPLAAKAIQMYSYRPDTLTFVAPPNELSRWSALVGFTRAARARTRVGAEATKPAATLEMFRRFVTETGTHTPEYFKLIHNARRFNQLASAVALQSMGIREVSMVVPKNDEMFSSYELPMGNDEQGITGVRYAVVEGGHGRFSIDPLGMWHEAEQAPYAIVNEETLGLEVPERLSTPPTISESLSIAAHGLQRLTRSRLQPVA